LSEEEGIPIGLGELFSQIANKLNNVSLEESAFLSEPSGDNNRIQTLQSSGSVKNSKNYPQSLEENQQKHSRNSS